jgi:hypothetical protein
MRFLSDAAFVVRGLEFDSSPTATPKPLQEPGVSRR